MLRNISSIIRHENIFDGFNETKYRKILACIYGYKAKQPKYGFSIERKRGKLKKFSFKAHHAENENFSTKPNTWITPGIPYLLLIIAGFVIQLLLGDLIMNGLSTITNLA
ncbi:A24 family peptidase C-terminal domain-containing protein [Ralstonia sp.]|uniref:A24 family peptidase C-terminal domain-containing protein n=1 Tax=Ralstonia sp. TaxID=54061 RepID=UPI0025F4EDEB|nr:A24 family peptidase C-terminal domain-containing protein [Ralstonia sp.]